ncbi:GNAT family N-acetyltransferase [Maribacter ulvicola]|uniref:Protein N-acetyltransferase, RimJ/RimL family n=1 Tax=Maribacter ulvicola TaxID=228959 RepID=A0A1N6RW80_9FLAO|nr:GNAT family N-acetyltransferase [Maribacter ulvicola]SIQ32972.1 Protein N-acetyltransferase, RimJ/RimL family [Maribacter ulvicola]
MNKLAIQTDRLELRLIEMVDLKVIHQLHCIPETDEFNTLGIPESIEETRQIIEPWIKANNTREITNYTFAIQHKADDKFIGLFGLRLGAKKYKRAEIWYKLDIGYWNKGLATEVVKEVLNYGFNVLGLHRIEAGCAVANLGSAKVMEKVGMTQEGRKRQILPLKSGWSDSFEYAILESDVRH